MQAINHVHGAAKLEGLQHVMHLLKPNEYTTVWVFVL